MLRPLNALIKYAALFYRGIAPGERYCLCEAILTLRLYFRRHFKAATSVPPLEHVRVAPAGEYVLRTDFFISLYFVYSLSFLLRRDRGRGAGGRRFSICRL